MSDEEKPHEIIIVRRRGGRHDGHHGGAWKIAFADFMTAMMAFFLVLWIVNSTSKETRSSVARYFNPIKLAASTPARKGLQDPKENEFEEEDHKKSKDSPAGGPGGKKQPGAETGAKGSSGEADTNRTAAADQKMAEKESAQKKAPQNGAASEPKDSKVRPGYFVPTRTEAELFEDPMAALADISKSDRAGQMGIDAPKVFRDPFEPIAPVIAPLPNASQSPRANAPIPKSAVSGPQPNPAEGGVANPDKKSSETEAKKAGEQDKKGGEQDTSNKAGESDKAASLRKMLDDPNAKQTSPQKGPETGGPAQGEAARKAAEAAGEPAARIEALQARVALALKDDVNAKGGPQIEVRKTEDGLLISLTDALDFGMFAIGSAEPQPRTVRVLEKLGQALKNETGALVVVGHTDSRPFKAGSSDNWKLSVARAEMAFYMLMRGGVAEKRFERIEGHADKAPRNANQTDAAENRRIEILVRKPAGAK